MNRVIMQDTGVPSLEKRGYIAPGQNVMIVNNNDNFIPELGTRVVGIDWFLARDSKPITDEQLLQEKQELINYEDKVEEHHLQTTKKVKLSQTQKPAKSGNQQTFTK